MGLVLGSAGMSMLSLYQRKVGGGEPSVSVQRSTALLPMVAEVGTWATGLEGGTAGERGGGAGAARRGTAHAGEGGAGSPSRRRGQPSREGGGGGVGAAVPWTMRLTSDLAIWPPSPTTSQMYFPVSSRVTVLKWMVVGENWTRFL